MMLVQKLRNFCALLSRESEGSFRYGNYHREANDLRDVIQHFRWENFAIIAIVGHSKGLSVVLWSFYRTYHVLVKQMVMF